MKKITKIACIVLVVGLLSWYFYQTSKNRNENVSVIGTDCSDTIPEIHLLVKNSTDKEVAYTIRLTLINKDTKKKTVINYPMQRPLKSNEFRQENVQVSDNDLKDFDCGNYEIKTWVKK